MSLLPPPGYEVEGFVLYDAPSVPDSLLVRYESYAAEKRRHPVYIEDDLDDDQYPDDVELAHRLMRIRCMPNAYDLTLILNAACHMMLMDKYEVVRSANPDIADQYERTLIEVHYTIGTRVVTERRDRATGDTQRRSLVRLDVSYRHKCLKSLFEAAGYVVKWGNALNIRR